MDLHGIYIPGNSVYSSILNTFLEVDDPNKDNPIRQSYAKLYQSPQIDYDMEIDYRLSRKIFEQYAVFTTLNPQVGIETILKQGILKRCAGEAIFNEKMSDERFT